MSGIILATLNARYLHASLGLRCLYANLGELRSQCTIREFTLESWPIDIAEQLLAERPRIIGLGVYIWNVEQSTRLVLLLKRISPQTRVVIGGPEVSHEWAGRKIYEAADYLVTGAADLSFAALCRQLLDGAPPAEKVVCSPPVALQQIAFPYAYYSDRDIAQRLIYVEASRGCPFRCEFCLSALDRSAWSFELTGFLGEMERLLQRGARHFKFVDRTFNLKAGQSGAILDFFLQRMEEGLFLHFEVIPDRLPEALRERLRRFPPGSLQLEIGIQTFNPEVAARIDRRQDFVRSEENLRWLRTETQAHIHADLIVGLPGEGLESFAAGFDRLVALAPHEIQVGLLKRLPGTPIDRHSDAFSMRYNPEPPYNVLSTAQIDFALMQRLNRFARYWDLLANSGRFRETLPLLLGSAPFARFLRFSDWLYAETGQVHRFALKRLFELLYLGMVEMLGEAPRACAEALARDFRRSGVKGVPAPLRDFVDGAPAKTASADSRSSRQARH
jgi:radical SAM superfamily enzyme YgiQ (UPF0313 family)